MMADDHVVVDLRTTARLAPRPVADGGRQVISLVALGYSNAQIAATLGVTRGATAHRVAGVLETLDCCSRREVADWAAAHGLAPAPA
jgi:DNA-binding NarL/FixJ family response regulator